MPGLPLRSLASCSFSCRRCLSRSARAARSFSRSWKLSPSWAGEEASPLKAPERLLSASPNSPGITHMVLESDLAISGRVCRYW